MVALMRMCNTHVRRKSNALKKFRKQSALQKFYATKIFNTKISRSTVYTEGKEIMREKGVKEFAKTASSTYKTISASEKEELRKKCSDEKPVMVKDIKHEVHKIFKNMDKQVEPNLAFYVSLLYGSLGSLGSLPVGEFRILRLPCCRGVWDP